jgi:hypothetical protein
MIKGREETREREREEREMSFLLASSTTRSRLKMLTA